MTYQISDGTSKVVINGDVVTVIPGFLPANIGPNDVLMVSDTSRSDILVCNMLYSELQTQIINLDPTLIKSVWRKQ